MDSEIFSTSVMGVSSKPGFKFPYYKNAISPFLGKVAYRLFSEDLISKIAEYRFYNTVNENDIVYLWPGTSAKLYRKIKNKGCIIIREYINSHQAYAKKILDKEYMHLDMGEYSEITYDMIQQENSRNSYTDIFFSPSPFVSDSLINNNIKKEAIINTSYGLKESEIIEERSHYNDENPITFLFVGTICIRKGIHKLLAAWSKNNIHGKLLLVGKIDEDIKDYVNNYLSDNVIHITYTDNLIDLYKDADVFILPSLEEGSPLVTYLALGAGLPSIVSPAGGGGIIDKDTGIIISPYNENEMIDAINTLARNNGLREKLGKNAHKKSRMYTWENVGKKRADLLEKMIHEIREH